MLGRLTVAIAVAAGLALPAPAGARLLVATYNEGLEPHAELQGHTRSIKNPERIRVETSGALQGEAKGTFTIRCTRGAKTSSRGYKVTGMTPAQRTVRIRGRWDECRIAKAEARYVDPFIEGWIQIRAWGNS